MKLETLSSGAGYCGHSCYLHHSSGSLIFQKLLMLLTSFVILNGCASEREPELTQASPAIYLADPAAMLWSEVTYEADVITSDGKTRQVRIIVKFDERSGKVSALSVEYGGARKSFLTPLLAAQPFMITGRLYASYSGAGEKFILNVTVEAADSEVCRGSRCLMWIGQIWIGNSIEGATLRDEYIAAP